MSGYALQDYFGDDLEDWDPDDVAVASIMWSIESSTACADDEDDSFGRSLSPQTAWEHPEPGQTTVHGAPTAVPDTASASPCAKTAASAQATQIGPQMTQR